SSKPFDGSSYLIVYAGPIARDARFDGHTVRSAPVTWADSSRTRKAIASATLSTGTQPWRSLSGMAARFAGVSIVLGSTEFTVTPCPRISWASAWTKVMTPAFDTV